MKNQLVKWKLAPRACALALAAVLAVSGMELPVQAEESAPTEQTTPEQTDPTADPEDGG